MNKLDLAKAEGEMKEARQLIREVVLDLLHDPDLNRDCIKKLNRVEVLLREEEEMLSVPPWIRNPNV